MCRPTARWTRPTGAASPLASTVGPSWPCRGSRRSGGAGRGRGRGARCPRALAPCATPLAPYGRRGGGGASSGTRTRARPPRRRGPAGAPRPVAGDLPAERLVEHDVAPYAALRVLGAQVDAVAHGPGLGDELPPVEGDQLVHAEAGAGGHGDEEVVAGALVGVGDTEDGVDVGAGGDAGRGSEEAGHRGGTWRIGRSEQRLLEGRRGSSATPDGRRPTSCGWTARRAEGELRLCRSRAENRSAKVEAAGGAGSGGGSRTR